MKTVPEKKRQRTYQANKEREVMNFEPLTRRPAPPVKLTGEALKYYNNVTAILLGAGTLTRGDLSAIVRASQMYAIHQQAVKDVEINGAYQITQSGYSTKNGYYQVMTDSDRALGTFERAFGLTPYSRSKLPTAPEPEKKNPFDII